MGAVLPERPHSSIRLKTYYWNLWPNPINPYRINQLFKNKKEEVSTGGIDAYYLKICAYTIVPIPIVWAQIQLAYRLHGIGWMLLVN